MASALAVYSRLSKLTATWLWAARLAGSAAQTDQIGRIRHVAVMHQERHVADMRVLIEMIDARGVERG
jgi:hypothetical protein